MYLLTRWFGTFICDKKGVKYKILFPKKPELIMKRLQKIENNKILSEEKKISKDKKLIVNEKRLQNLGDFKPDDPFFKKIEFKPSTYGYSEDLLKEAMLLLTNINLDKKLRSKDLQIVQMVNSLDDLIQISNLLNERYESWSLIPTPKNKMQPLLNSIKTIKEESKTLEKKIQDDMNNLAPNISTIIGPLIGARLMAIAGGLDKLALLPASTIQVLGAEKALFRFKKEGGKPPKHGVIFQHPMIKKTPLRVRGKVSRAIATKLSIAAKADAFTGRDISQNLKEDLQSRIKNINNSVKP